MDADDKSSSLLAKLQSSDLSHIRDLIFDHLAPFNPLISQIADPKNPIKSSINDTRTLAKRYLSFLNRALSLIPARLSETPKIDPQFAPHLFDSYKLSLQCLECISSQLSCKPYMIHLQRAKLIRCYDFWGKYIEVEREGFSVLEGLKGVCKGCKEGCRFVPGLGANGPDRDLAGLVVEIVIMLVKCVYMKESKCESDYRRVMVLVDEVAPWFRVLDASFLEKLHRVLVTHLTKCTLFFVGELNFSNRDLVLKFLVATFTEYRRSSVKDQLYKYAARVCSALFSLQNDQSLAIKDILLCVLDTIAAERKVDNESSTIELLELVSYCANKCRIATKHLCCELATHIKKLAGDLHKAGLILRLYSTGLFLDDIITTKRNNNPGSIRFLFNKDEVLLGLRDLLGTFKSPSTSFWKMKKTKLFLLPIYNAIKFVCQPLAEVVNSARNEIFAQVEDPDPTVLSTLLDVFLHFYDMCSTLDKKSTAFDERTVLSVALAALALSFRTKSYIKESVKIIKELISADWIQADGFKFLCPYTYNIGVTLLRSNQVKEASMAVELSCKAAWACVSHLRKTFIDQSSKSSDFVSEDDSNFVNEACGKSAFLLDLSYQCNDHNKAIEVVKFSLEEWSEAAKVFKGLPGPSALVKQWVKIECKFCKAPDTEIDAVSLFLLLSPSESISSSLGVILDLELSSYNEVRALNPELCHKMQMDIIDIILEKVYNKEDDFHLQKSKLLITKGRELRASGFEGLDACIQYLSEAISLLLSKKNGVNDQTSHHLAVAYVLRALCIQEAEPKKSHFEDIDLALKQMKQLLTPKRLADDQCDIFYENFLNLLYHVVDMLSLKGCTKFHFEIYELVIGFFEKKKIPLRKCLAFLWQGRRLSHALCPSPLNEASILILSQKSGEPSQFLNFWKNCLSGSLPLEIGFWQRFSFMFTNNSCGLSHYNGSYIPKIKVDDVKLAASDLRSSVPVSSDSAFLAAHLYYDLCERMISYGKLNEALSFAKEAHHLRCKLLQEKFRYSSEQQSEVYDKIGETIKKQHYTLSYFQIRSSVAASAWPQDKKSINFEGTVLTPWNVLQCYLESTLQVGIAHELVGDGSEAESLLLWGKNISSLQGLTLFEVAFSSVLGKVYRKQQIWDKAEKELQSAKELFKKSCTYYSCSKCKLLNQATILLELGDLFRSRKLYLHEAETEYYEPAMDKLYDQEWKNLASNPEELIDEKAINSDAPTKKGQKQGDVPEANSKRSRKIKNPVKPLIQEQRTTRSKSRLQTIKENAPSKEVKVVPTETLETCSSSVDIGAGLSCSCNKNKCWYCLLAEVVQAGSINNFVLMKWEFVRRQLLCKIHSGLGKCMYACGKTDESHEQLKKSISVLFSRNSFSEPSDTEPNFFLDLIGKDIPENVFAIEHAALLYNMCYYALKSYPCRISFCDMANFPSWLMLAFVLCREVPILFQKVSRLLAVVFVLSGSTELFSQPDAISRTLSENQWASYFHQASIGTHINHQVFSSMIGKEKVQDSLSVEGCCPTNSRLVPEKFKDLEGHVQSFFQNFPGATIIGISLLGDPFSSLLSNILKYPAPAWLLLSRLSSNNQPVVLLLPVNSILKDTDPCSRNLFEGKCWHSPWGSTVVDEVAPVFRLILEKSYLSSSGNPLEDTRENRLLWWNQRKGLDQKLGNFTRNLENKWLGPWKYLLMGEYDNKKAVYNKCVPDLKAKCKVAKLACSREEPILQLILNGGCFVDRMDHQEDGFENISERVSKLLVEAKMEAKEEDLNREPVILILDYDIQMLPWESLPILRDQEVYRMPSIQSIFATLDRCHKYQDQVGRFPMIDPLDAFYLLNPSGDLIDTQTEFEDWFRDQNLEGKAGISPTVDELVLALRSHDLYIYLGHGSGAQYIPGHEIQKLENCAATFLIGCSSGTLSLNGCYAPKGAPLSYLLAGSPVIIANLWDVTDKDIDRFGKAMLDNWLKERSAASSDCTQCKDLVEKKFRSMQITKTQGKNKKKTSRKNSTEDFDLITTNSCNHRPNIGSFVGQARDACRLPFLIGAAPVCYGVPTRIRKKKI